MYLLIKFRILSKCLNSGMFSIGKTKWIRGVKSNLNCDFFFSLNLDWTFTLNSNCSNFLDLRNLKEEIEKIFSFKNWLTFHYSNKLLLFQKNRPFGCFRIEFWKLGPLLVTNYSRNQSHQNMSIINARCSPFFIFLNEKKIDEESVVILT